jgi:hypothetical protein
MVATWEDMLVRPMVDMLAVTMVVLTVELLEYLKALRMERKMVLDLVFY